MAPRSSLSHNVIPPVSHPSLLNDYYGGIRFPISFYASPPHEGSISLQTLIEAAIDRLETLQLLDHRDDPHFSTKMLQLLRTRNLMIKSSDDSIEAKLNVALKDAVSHFTLKLAYGREQQHREWLIHHEEMLMDFKFNALCQESLHQQDDLVDTFLRNQGMTYRIIEDPSVSGKVQDRELWRLCTKFKQSKDPLQKITKIYEVTRFSDITQLLRSRQIYINNMIGYVTNIDLKSVVMSHYKKLLLEGFALVERRLPVYEKVMMDPRLAEFLKMLPSSSTVDKYKAALNDSEKYRLSLSNISMIWKQSFPPCMQRLYTNLKKDGHLKHWGRQQFWLFLKDAGLSMEDSIYLNRSLWKDPAAFDKEFRYNLRHLYGQEGKRVSRDAYSCSKILGGTIPLTGAGEYHGCPFKTLDSEPLKAMLIEYGLAGNQFEEINAYKRNHEYQIACTKLFTSKHPGYEGGPIGNHPNVYMLESVKHLSNSKP